MNGLVDSYRQNLHEAQRALEIALAVKDEYKFRDLIAWGTTPRGFTGWLVRGKKADDVYSACAKAQSDVEHWGNLIIEETRQPELALAPLRPDPMTPDEVEERKREIAAQVAARLGEKLDDAPL